MTKLACAALFAVVVATSLGAMFITQNQALVGSALSELRLESIAPKDPKVVGGPSYFKVTKATLEHLQKLEKEGKIIEVDGTGGLTTNK